MKMRRAAGFLLALAALLLAGCGENARKVQNSTFGNADNGIYLFSNLSVEDCKIYSFDKDYYDDAEFKTYLQKDLDAYNESHTFRQPETTVAATDKSGATLTAPGPEVTEPISIISCEKKEDKLVQSLLYATTEDFILYNEAEVTKRGGTALQAGKLSEADRSVISESYQDPDGNSFDLNTVVNSKDAASYRYLICNFEANLYGDGEIVALTSGGSYDKEYNSVSVKAGSTVIVIFRDLQ